MAMSPMKKKMLMLAVLGVGGYVAYKKIMGPSASTPKVKQAEPISPAVMESLRAKMQQAGQFKVTTFAGIQEALGVRESLGVSEALGSLGGSIFR